MAERWVIAVRMRQFGDVLSTLESLRALRSLSPEYRVALVADEHFHPLLRSLAYIDLLLPSPPFVRTARDLVAYARYVRRLRRLRPVAVVDFHGNVRTALLTVLVAAPMRIGFDVRIRRVVYSHIVARADCKSGRLVKRDSMQSAMALMAPLGVQRDSATVPELPADPEITRRGREALVAAGVGGMAVDQGRVVGLNPGRAYPAKAWPSERFVALARAFVASGHSVVVLWGPGEEAAARAIAELAGANVCVAPPMELVDLPGLLRCLRLVVTIDSGLKHLAACCRVHTLTLFGSTDPREWHMGIEDDRYLWKGFSCSPCRRLDCPFGAPCMDFDVDGVLAIALDMLRSAA